jgi:hypothetical protein
MFSPVVSLACARWNDARAVVCCGVCAEAPASQQARSSPRAQAARGSMGTTVTWSACEQTPPLRPAHERPRRQRASAAKPTHARRRTGWAPRLWARHLRAGCSAPRGGSPSGTSCWLCRRRPSQSSCLTAPPAGRAPLSCATAPPSRCCPLGRGQGHGATTPWTGSSTFGAPPAGSSGAGWRRCAPGWQSQRCCPTARRRGRATRACCTAPLGFVSHSKAKMKGCRSLCTAPLGWWRRSGVVRTTRRTTRAGCCAQQTWAPLPRQRRQARRTAARRRRRARRARRGRPPTQRRRRRRRSGAAREGSGARPRRPAADAAHSAAQADAAQSAAAKRAAVCANLRLGLGAFAGDAGVNVTQVRVL